MPLRLLRGMLPEMQPSPRTLRLAVSCFVVFVCFSAAAQQFVPRVPSRSAPLPLAVGEATAGGITSLGLRVVRQGSTGTQLIPAALDLPAPGTYFQAETFDWYRNGTRVATIRDMRTLEAVYVLQPSAELVVVSQHAAELVAGTVQWSPAAVDRDVLGMGELVVSGSGRVRLRRTLRQVSVQVEAGRFDVRQSGRLVAAPAAGQEFVLPLTDSEAARVVAAAPDAVAELAAQQAAVLDELLATQTLSGATLAELWDGVRVLAPLLARATTLNVAWPTAADLSERAIGESLRVLAAFAFVPAVGM